MKLHDLHENDDLDDSSPFEHDREMEKQIKEVFIKLGFNKHDISDVSVEDGEAEVTIDTGHDGLPLKLFEKLKNSDMSSEYFIAPGDNITVVVKFKINQEV